MAVELETHSHMWSLELQVCVLYIGHILSLSVTESLVKAHQPTRSVVTTIPSEELRVLCKSRPSHSLGVNPI